MTASERSILGLSKQTAKGTPATTGFQYMLFSQGQVGPQSMAIPLDMEIGGGAVLRDVVKVGVMSAGQLEFIPRPKSIGHLLCGAIGKDWLYETCLVQTVLTAGAQLDVAPTAGIPAVPCKLLVKGLKAGATLTGNVTVTGTDVDDDPLEETIALNGDAAVASVGVFKTVTAIDLPARVTALDKVSVGFGSYNGAYDHVFRLPTDQFEAPYYTIRSAPGGIWGEQLQDCRVSDMNLNWRGANFVRGAMGLVGGLPSKTDHTAWTGVTPDSLAPFITPISTIELPDGTSAKCLQGSFTSTLAIPMEEQFIVGSYSPDDFDINQRAFIVQMVLKISDGDLYTKMMYDGSNAAATAWAATVLKAGDIDLKLASAQEVATGVKYQMSISGNGSAAPSGNIVWTAEPIGLRAGRQVLMNVTGVFLADATKAIEVKLTNGEATAY